MINTVPEIQEEKIITAVKSVKGGSRHPGGRRKGDLLPAMLFLSPTLIIFGAFILFPVFFSFYLSFQQWNMFSGNTSFIGLDNYIRMFESEEFWSVLKNTARVSFIRSASGERD